MKFFCTQKNLNQGLAVCEKVVAKSFTLPILQNILLTSEKNKRHVKLSSTDLEVGIEVIIPAKIEEEGKVTTPAKLFSGFVGNLPEEKIEFSEKNNQILIHCGSYRATIKGESAKEFPLIPQLQEVDSIFLKTADFIQGLSSVINSVSPLDIKPEISGIFVQFNEEEVYFTGTDSFRLSEKIINQTKKNKHIRKVIIPRKTCDLFVRIFSERFAGEDANETLNIKIGDNQILIQNTPGDNLVPKIQIVSRVIDGEYPNYEQIIPTNFLTSVEVSRDELAQHIKTASLFSSKINDITFKVSPKKQEINILSKDQDFGSHSSTLKCKAEGEEKETIFNFMYLLDGLNSISSPQISIKLTQGTSPALISSTEDNNFKYILMPIKT